MMKTTTNSACVAIALVAMLISVEPALSFGLNRLGKLAAKRSALHQRLFGGQNTLAKRGDGKSHGGFLKIMEAPPRLLEARQYGKTVLECSASGNPAPQITWYKDGRPLIKDFSHSDMLKGDYGDFAVESLSETKSKITLDCISEADAGLYECVAKSDDKETSVGAEVQVVSFEPTGCRPRRLLDIVQSPPRIYQWMGTYMQPIGKTAHLLCRADGAQQTVWIGPSGDIIQGNGNGKHRVLPNGDLIIEDLTFDDMGMFKCIASNDRGEDFAETFVYPHAQE